MIILPRNRCFGFRHETLLVLAAGVLACSDATSPGDTGAKSPAVPAAITLIVPDDGTLAVGGQVLLEAEVVDSAGIPAADQTVAFSTLTPDVLSISQNGNLLSVVGSAEGTGLIIVKRGGLADTAALVVSASATVSAAASGGPLQLVPDQMLFDRSNSMWFVSAMYSNASGSKTVTTSLRSTNTNVVRVDAKGWVTSGSNGKAYIVGRYNGVTDSVRVQVGGVQVGSLRLQSDTASIASVGGQVRFHAEVLDTGGRLVINPALTWTSLDPQVATVSGNGGVGTVRALSNGSARIVAKRGTRADTGIVQIGGTRNPSSAPASVTITPHRDTIPTVGGTIQLTAVIRDAQGQPIPQAPASWNSLDPTIATLNSGSGPSVTATVSGLKAGSARITGSTNGKVDTAFVVVGAGQNGWTLTHTPANPTTGTPVTITATVTSPSGVATVDIIVDGNIAKSCRGATCSHTASYAAGSHTYSATATYNGGGTGSATPATFDITTSSGGSSSPGVVPPELLATIGPLVPRGTLNQTLDALFLKEELKNYLSFASQVPNTTGSTANHYGALRSRIEWAIRNGQPYGPGANNTSQHMYARGRHIVLHYLQAYSKPNKYSLEPHNNTALADIEILWWLEQLPDAWNHIWTIAHRSMSTPMNRFSMQVGDPRQIAVPLQAYSAAHRMGIPFKPSPYSASTWNDHKATSWRNVGEMQINAVLGGGNIHANGAVHSYDHASQCGKVSPCEAYFMNAMLATEFLRWHGFVAPNTKAFIAARLIVDHLISEQARKGANCLPYLSSDSGCAPDLAAFYVWPALVLWQETGDARYRTFAMQNLNAAQKAWVIGAKQFNQTFSTGSQTAEALLAGIPWH